MKLKSYKVHLYSVASDFLFLVILLLLFNLSASMLKKTLDGLKPKDVLLTLSNDELISQYGLLSTFFVWLIISIIIILFVSLLLYALTRSFVYSKILTKKMLSLKDYLRFSLLSVLTFIFYFCLVLILEILMNLHTSLIIGTTSKVLLLLLILLDFLVLAPVMFYFVNYVDFMNYYFFVTKSLKESLHKANKEFVKFRRNVTVCYLVGLFFFCFSLLTFILGYYLNSFEFYSIIETLILLYFFSWYRLIVLEQTTK